MWMVFVAKRMGYRRKSPQSVWLQNRRKTFVYLHPFVTLSSIFLTYLARNDWYFTSGDHKTWHELQTVELNVSIQVVHPLGDVFSSIYSILVFSRWWRGQVSRLVIKSSVCLCVRTQEHMPACLPAFVLLHGHKDNGHIHSILKYQEYANIHSQCFLLFLFGSRCMSS